MTTVSATQIKKLHDVTQECLNAIKNLDVDITNWDPLVVHLLSQKLDTETFTDYVESLKDSRELPVLKEFLKYLENKFTALESSRRKQDSSMKNRYQTESQPGTSSNKNRYHQISSSGMKHQNYYQSNQSCPTYPARAKIIPNNYPCSICNKTHGIYQCQQFFAMSNTDKLNIIEQLKLCKNCLYCHNEQPCKSQKRCRVCRGEHHTILHDAHSMTNNSVSNKYSMEPGNSHVTRRPDICEVLLATALIKVQAADGTYRTMRALIDQGSQTCLITERGAQSLELPRQKWKGVITGVGEKESQCKGFLTLQCMSMDTNFTFSTAAYIMGNLIKNLPSKTLSKPNWDILTSLPLADPEFYICRSVDILLGAEIYSNIIQSGISRSEHTPIIAQQTKLGWILCGAVAPSLHCNVITNNIEEIERFWQIEDISDEPSLTSEDQHCLDFYHNTTSRQKDGKYVVRLPLKQDFENKLGKSKPKAVAQFLNLERKLNSQPDIAKQYNAFIKEYIELGHMKLATASANIEYYLPHHCVLRHESLTTKLRVVFNASAKTTSNTSLNDVMMRGPNLQKDLMSLVLKWRQFKIAFTADIEKMFRMINLHEDDQNLQKIIWRFDHQPGTLSHKVLHEYLLTTVTYGTAAAPFLAMMTLQRLANDEKENYPEAAQVVKDSFYMDDILHGSHDVTHGLQLKRDLIKLLKLGGFNLRKWSSNVPELIQSDQQHNENFEFKTEQNQKALGLQWNPANDAFSFRTKIDDSNLLRKTTKRELLSSISKLFDPLGWLSPFTVKLKLLFQEVWQRDIQWNDQLPEDLQAEWSKIKSDIHHINKIKLSRWINTDPQQEIELHGFCDASSKAYACVIYCKTNNKQIRVSLLAAKTRIISKKKKFTLPKLELCGAHLLSTLMERVLQCLPGYNIKLSGWVDSTAVLGWIQGNPDKWKPFVSRRVADITKIIPAECWRFVPSHENPADCASRGITASQLLAHPLWWQGPSWLSNDQLDLNKTCHTFDTSEELETRKQVNTISSTECIVEYLLDRYSSYQKLIRVISWLRRVLIPKKQRTSYLTLTEINEAKLIIFKHCQQKEFNEEVSRLSQGICVHSKSKILSLNPFLDDQGLLRVGGRLRNANLHPEMKNPIIIPHNSRISELLIDYAHQATFHGGVRLTLSFLRRRYWVIRGIQRVKKRLRMCVTCKKHKPNLNNHTTHQIPNPKQSEFDLHNQDSAVN